MPQQMVPSVHSQRPGFAPLAHSPPRRPRASRSGSSRPGPAICAAGVWPGASPGAARPPGAAPWRGAPSRHRRGPGLGRGSRGEGVSPGTPTRTLPHLLPSAAGHSRALTVLQPPRSSLLCPGTLSPRHCTLFPHCPPLFNLMAPRFQLPSFPREPSTLRAQISVYPPFYSPLSHPALPQAPHRSPPPGDSPVPPYPHLLIHPWALLHGLGPTLPYPFHSPLYLHSPKPPHRAPDPRSPLRPHQPPLPPPPPL